MASNELPIQYLLTLPPRMVEAFERLEGRSRPDWFATSDPSDSPLGSGGGTAHALFRAWQATGGSESFPSWLAERRKLIVHGGGQSRRLPAYAPTGKMLMPVPVFRWARGQRLQQNLLDLQLPDFERVFEHAGPEARVMVASGDVMLRFGRDLPKFPAVDVLGLGMWVRPEMAEHFGVFFCLRQRPDELAFYLQKPSAARIRELATEHLCLVDTGMWLLSERAVAVLMQRSGWDSSRQAFTSGKPQRYELYSQFGLALGNTPVALDPEVKRLTSAVIPLPEAEFYHFGTSRQMIESVSALQNLELDEIKLGVMGAKRHPDQYLQNCRFDYPLRLEENHTLWVENSTIPACWHLASDHVLTGVPPNEWELRLDRGVCLDFIPVREHDFCVRFYGMDDPFRGPIGDISTAWLGRPAPAWFMARDLPIEGSGCSPTQDIQEAPLFPILSPQQLDPHFLEWLFAAHPNRKKGMADVWRNLTRLSANGIAQVVNLERVYGQRTEHRRACLAPMARNYRWNVFLKVNLESTAEIFAEAGHSLPPLPVESDHDLEPMQLVRDSMFRGAVLRHRSEPGWEELESQSFDHLRRMIIREVQLSPVTPACNAKADQIIWGRSPVRLDLAGGWTDTPPYCLENGGRVLNLAVDLNGQPPIQAFAKLSERPELLVRSIDLGVEQRVRTYEELDTFAQPASEFALAKAALALAGFLPRFHSQGGSSSLADQLAQFGGGIELSLLSAVPKGSGLGTSSILAATVLATLGDLCGLNWDRNALFSRTLALEQMLTTGGGWQDQAGGIFRGFKLIETGPGLNQKPILRWLPDHLFTNGHTNKSILLYYTGITRLAKSILHEIVRGIFLNSTDHLRIVEEIGANATRAFNAAQKDDLAGLVEAVRASWRLNQKLDAGTNPPAVEAILERVRDYVDAAKLLGAGGGGYMIIFAKDDEAGARIRQELTQTPPNDRARFVQLSVSDTGLQLTRS